MQVMSFPIPNIRAPTCWGNRYYVYFSQKRVSLTHSLYLTPSILSLYFSFSNPHIVFIFLSPNPPYTLCVFYSYSLSPIAELQVSWCQSNGLNVNKVSKILSKNDSFPFRFYFNFKILPFFQRIHGAPFL